MNSIRPTSPVPVYTSPVPVYRSAVGSELMFSQYRKAAEIGLRKIEGLTSGGLSRYCLANDEMSLFYCVKNPALKGQWIWKSTGKVTGRQFSVIIDAAKKYNQSVQINTGTHGSSEAGATSVENPQYACGNFYREDIETYKRSRNVAILWISDENPPIYLSRANWVVNAWCFSEKTPDLLIPDSSNLLASYYLKELALQPLFNEYGSFPMKDFQSELREKEENVESGQPILLERLFTTQESALSQRFLIVGEAGVGKSALCNKIAYSWAKREPFLSQFKAVLCIPLHLLNQDKELLTVRNAHQFLAKAMLNVIEDEPKVEATLLQFFKRYSTELLVVLDGYDEALPALRNALRCIFSNSDLHIILTSRDSIIDSEVNAKFSRKIFCLGFNDHHIRDYCNWFFNRKGAENLDTEAFLHSLQKNQQLFQLAHKPLLLLALCSLWEEKAELFGSTVTDLYGCIVDLFLNWQFRKRGLLLEEIPVRKKDGLLWLLAKIASQSFESGDLKISKQVLENMIRQKRFEECELLDLVESGLLKVVGPGVKRSYQFLHLSIQEYLIAYAVTKETEVSQEAFIKSHRDEPSYSLVMTFLAGILSKEDLRPQKPTLQFFFDNLCEGVSGSFGADQARVRLILRSLNECSTDTPLQALEELCSAPFSLLEVNIRYYSRTLPLGVWLIKEGLANALMWFVNQKGSAFLHWRNFSQPGIVSCLAAHGYIEILNWLNSRDPALILNECKLSNPMLAAAYQGQVEVMRWFYERDSTLIHNVDDYDGTIMHVAASENQLGVMEWLHKTNSTLIHQKNGREHTPMHYAALNSCFDAVRWLHVIDFSLIRKVDKDGKTASEMALYQAARSGDLEMMKWLHDLDTSLIRKVDSNGRHPMHFAAFFGHFEAVRWLNSCDPSLINTCNEDLDTPGEYAFSYAAREGNLEMMKWLHGIDTSLIRKVDSYERTHMHYAVENNHLETVCWLYKQCPQLINKKDIHGQIPMHWSIRNLSMFGQLEKLAPSLLNTSDRHGKTPRKMAMHHSVCSGNLKMMRWLHRQDCTSISIVEDGKTLMHTAARNGRVEVMDWLNKQDPTLLNKVTNEGETVMHQAAAGGHLQTMQWLNERDPTLLNKVTNKGETVMHQAAGGGHLQAMQWLNERDRRLLNKVTNKGETVMYQAASQLELSLEVLKWLDEQGLILSEADSFGKTAGKVAIARAARSGYIEVVCWLYEKDSSLIRVTDAQGCNLMHLAARGGDLEMMRWLHSKDRRLILGLNNFHQSVMDEAINGTHLDVSKWLEEHQPKAGSYEVHDRQNRQICFLQ